MNRRTGLPSSLVTATIVAATLLVAAGCSGPDDPPGSYPDAGSQEDGGEAADTAPDSSADPDGGSADVGPAEISVSPGSLLFEGVAKGESKKAEVTVKNIGERDLVVDELRLTETDPTGGAGGELALGSNAPDTPVTISPDISKSFDVVYSPADFITDRGSLLVVTRGSQTDDVEVPIETVNASADLDAPELVRFGSTPKGESSTRTIVVYNRGVQDLELKGVQVKDDANFSTSFGPRKPPVSLSRGDNYDFDVVFSAPDESKRTARLILETDDPDDMNYEVRMTANRPEPCIELEKRAVDFGEMTSSETTTKLGILNCNLTRGLTVESVSFTTDGNGAFELVDPPTFPLELSGAQEQKLTIKATLEEKRQARGLLRVESNDTEKSPVLIDVIAERTE